MEEETTYVCHGCGEWKKSCDMSRISVKYRSGRCRKCHSEINKFIAQQKAINRSPQNYLQCDDCDSYFYKYVHSSCSAYKQRTIRTECVKCSSKNISEVG